MTREDFEKLIIEAVEILPENIRAKMNNVDIILEDGESPNHSLFGLYLGVSQLRRGAGYGAGMTLPDKITIWKGSIERYAGDDAHVPPLVRKVVWHEIGHHFGFDEAGIQKLERKWEEEGKV